MTAASLLAKRGLSVLLVEQQGKPGGSCTSFRRAGVTCDVGTAMLYGFGERGFKPFRFLFNELEEPIAVVAHATLARMTFEGEPTPALAPERSAGASVTFWPDIERFLQELDRLFPDEKEGLRAFYRDFYIMYENIVLRNEVIVPPSEFSPRQGLRRLLTGPVAMLKMQKLLDTSVRSLLDRYFRGEAVINFFDKLCSAYCYTTSHIRPERLAWAQGLVPTFPSMTLYLVVDRTALPADVLPWEVFIENRKVIDSSDLTLYVNALVDETLCPPDKLVITAIAPNLERWPAPGSAADRSDAYYAQKRTQAQRMLDQVEQHFPGFCSHIESLIVGTPTTIERYLLKSGGAVGGPQNMLDQQMLKRLHARRMEAGNFTGAARELHRHSPFGGLCGTACPAGQLCERHC